MKKELNLGMGLSFSCSFFFQMRFKPQGPKILPLLDYIFVFVDSYLENRNNGEKNERSPSAYFFQNPDAYSSFDFIAEIADPWAWSS